MQNDSSNDTITNTAKECLHLKIATETNNRGRYVPKVKHGKSRHNIVTR